MSPENPDNPPASQEAQELIDRLRAGQLLPEEQKQLAHVLAESPSILVAATHQQLYSGPLPPAEQLNQYDEATRKLITSMAQNEQTHTHKMREKSLASAVDKDRQGQLFGVIIAVTGLVVAGGIAPFSATASAIIGSVDLFGMVALFVAPRVLEKRREAE